MTARLLIVALLFFPWPAAAEQLGVNIYGLSYHFDRERAHRSGLDNEVNPGLGLRYRVLRSERLQWIFEAGTSTSPSSPCLAGERHLRPGRMADVVAL